MIDNECFELKKDNKDNTSDVIITNEDNGPFALQVDAIKWSKILGRDLSDQINPNEDKERKVFIANKKIFLPEYFDKAMVLISNNLKRKGVMNNSFI